MISFAKESSANPAAQALTSFVGMKAETERDQMNEECSAPGQIPIIPLACLKMVCKSSLDRTAQ